MFSFLKEVLLDTPIDMIKDSPILGSLMALIMLALFAMLFIIISAFVYYILNNSFTKSEKATARVVSKYFTAQHTVTTTQMMLVGKVMIPTTQITTYPDTWTLVVEKNHEQGEVNVSKSFYEEAKEQNFVEIMYHTGRLDKSFKPQSVLSIITQKVE